MDYRAFSQANPVTVDLESGIATGTVGIANFSNVYGGAGNDTLLGNEQDNILQGGIGDDLLDGRGGSDTLDESNSSVNLIIDLSRSDAQNTGIGNDIIINIENLRTGSGDDILKGLGNGADCILEGGLGNDRYVFAGNWNNYTITDIGGDDDIFDFSALNSDLNFIFDNSISITDGFSAYSHNSGGIERFLGGQGNDTFNIREGMAAGITIDGQEGIDKIDFTACTDGREVKLQAAGSSGMNGNEIVKGMQFANIDLLLGSSGEDKLAGADLAAIWRFDQEQYTYSAGSQQLVFYAFEHLQGGSDKDIMDYSGYGSEISINLQTNTIKGIAVTFGGMEEVWGSMGTDRIIAKNSGSTFALRSDGSGVADGWLTFAGIEDICGGSGADQLDFRAVEKAIELAISGISAQSGFTGNESVCGIRFSGINEIIGSGASDRAVNTYAAAVWFIKGGGNCQYHAEGQNLNLRSIELIVGSPYGDVLSYSDYTLGDALIAISGAGTHIGFKGSASGLLSFDNINKVIGSQQRDTLSGADLNAEWLLETSQYTYKAEGRELIFSNIELLQGGDGDDWFHFADGAVFTDNIDGGLGSDIIDYSAYTTDISVTLSSIGALDGMNGSVLGQNANTLTGSFANINVVTGGFGSDRITGAHNSAVFEIDGSNRYLAGGQELAFSSFEQLLGGSLDDTFRFGDGSCFTGTVAGGTGLDWLDFSANTSSIISSLSAFSETGYIGSVAAISGGFAGIDGIIGSIVTGVGGDKLYAIQDLAGNWVLNGVNSSYTAYGSATGLNFIGFELFYGGLGDDLFLITGSEAGRLFGGVGHDTFRLLDGASLAGSIDGGGGINTLDYSAYTTSVEIILPFTASHISLGIVGIQNIYGGQADDLIIGDHGDNLLSGGGGNDRLIGGLGDDSYLFADNFGTDTVIDSAGSDTLDFSSVTAILHFATGSYLVKDGINQVLYASVDEGWVSLIERFIGGAGDDVFSLDPDNELPAGTIIDGGSGSDTLDYSNYTTAVKLNLALGTATGKFTYAGFENVIGGTANDILIGDDNDNKLMGGAGDDQLTGGGGNDSLMGGDGNDIYYFSDNWGIDSISDSKGSDTVDFSAAQQDLIFNINIDGLVVFNGSHQLLVPANTLEQLRGGSGHDKFVFQDGATFTSPEGATLIDGGSGKNNLDYSAYTSSVQVNLAEALATGVDKILHIQNIIGGFGNDILIGDNSDNILAGGPGDDILQGGQGHDRYVFAAGWGNDIISENANEGHDTLDFGRINVAMVFTIGTDWVSISDGSSYLECTDGNIETFAGGSANDTFRFLEGAEISGSIDGQGGYDTLDLTLYTSDCEVILKQLGTINGFLGTTSLLGSNGFNNINNIIGSSAEGVSDTLIGMNEPGLFYLDEGRYQSVNTLDYSGFENLKGGSAQDIFIFTDSSNFDGSIFGGAGKDILDYSNCTWAVTINLGTRQATGLTGNFWEIEAILGGSSNDTLIGPDQGAVFRVTGSRAGKVTGTGLTTAFEFLGVENIQAGSGRDTLNMEDYDGSATLDLEENRVVGLINFSGIEAFIGSSSGADTIIGRALGSNFILNGHNSGTVDGQTFISFENLQGGQGNDSFAFSGKASLSGSINGGAGSNTLDYSNYSSRVIFNLQTSSSSGLAGFSNIQNLLGSKSADTIIGSDTDTLFIIDGRNSGSVNGIIFSSVENLQGGQGNDTFSLVGSGILDGTIAGNGGNNSLDYSGYAEGVTLNLQTLTCSGLAGFEGIQMLIGSANKDTIKGSNQGSNFLIIGLNQGIIDDTLSFISIETLIGGSGNDRFAFSAGGGLSGELQGGKGIDTLDYSSYGSGVDVNLATGIASNLAGKISQVENIIGSAFDDTLCGDGQANVINGLAGNDTLNGGGGNDIYIFGSDWGHDTIIEAANGGSDLVDFTNLTSDLIFILGNDYQISDGTNQLTHLGGQIEQLVGGSGNDRFRLIGSSAVKGGIDGGSGSNTLDYSAYDSALLITLSGLGSINGFAGTETSITSFDNIQHLIGSNSNTDVLKGLNSSSIFRISGLGSGIYESGERRLSFISIEGLNGGSASDLLDFSGAASALSLRVSSANASGFAGSVNHLLGGFTGMDEILGSSQTDTFIGLNQNAIFEISADVLYRYNNMALKLGGFEVLQGGSGNDTFAINDPASFNGSIDGQGGRDILSYANYQSAASVTLTGIGSIDGFAGTATCLNGSFTNIDRYVGSSTSGDVLTGLDENTVWNLQGFKLYASAGHNLDLSGVEILRGGNGDDTFIIKGPINFLLDGGGGNNTLDYSQFNSAITVNLQNSSATGLNSFSNIQALVGSTYGDTLIGYDRGSVFSITGSDTGLVDGTFTFTGVENLAGGSGDDSFAFSGSGGISGTVAGGEGSDTLDYSAYDSSVTVDLATGTATGIKADADNGCNGIENITGSRFNDSLTGDDGANIIDGGKGDDIFDGGHGNDTYIFYADWGSDTVNDTSGGADALDFSRVTAALEVDLAEAMVSYSDNRVSYSGIENITAGSGNDLFYIAGSQSMNLSGGAGNDKYIFSSNGLLNGTIDGGSGEDTLDYSGDSSESDQVYVLTGTGSQDGFNGMEIASLVAGFTNIDAIIGGLGLDTLQGMNIGSQFDIFSDRIEYTADGHKLTMNQVENLVGGTADDSFSFHGNGVMEGNLNSIDGQGGNNTLDYSSYASGRTFILTGLGSINGFAGTDSSAVKSLLSFNNILNLIGSNGEGDILKGCDTDSVYRITGSAAGSYENDGQSLSFAGIETLAGGKGYNTLDFSGMDSSRHIILIGANENGFAGSEAAIPAGFTGMDALVGSTAIDTFTGLDEKAIFQITDTVKYVYDNITLKLTGWENIQGGSADDKFVFSDGAFFEGKLDGQGGKDTLDYSAHQNAVVSLITGLGTIDGFAGIAGARGSFTNIDSYVGSSAADDVLTNQDVATIWDLEGATLYSATGNKLDLEGVEILRGGSGDDTFIIRGPISFLLDGGGGNNTLDYSQYIEEIIVNLQNSSAGLSSFRNIQALVGSAYGDTLIGYDRGSIFSIIGTDTGMVDGTFTFTGVENLVGGSGDDHFAFSGSGNISGTVTGGAGIDTLDYSAYSNSVAVNLATGTATDIQVGADNGISGIENIIGSAFADNLTGNDGANTIDGGAGNDKLYGQGGDDILIGGSGDDFLDGGAGDDTYVWSDNWGNDTVSDTFGSSNSLDFSGVAAALEINLAGAMVSYSENRVSYSGIKNITGGSGNDLVYIAGSQSMNLYGGAGNDTFIFTEQGILHGTIDGGSGNDILDYCGDQSTILDIRVFVLTAAGSQDGFAGWEIATIASGFTNIDNINGGLGMDTLQGLNSEAQFDIFKDRIEYRAEGHILIITMIENLVGGDADDTFKFHGEGRLPGNHNSIDGKSGQDTLDYSLYTLPVEVYLNGGISTGVRDGVAGIENIIGSPQDDILHGDNKANIIKGGAGNDQLYGWGGDDILNGGQGNDYLDGGTGNDTADYSDNTQAGIIISLLNGSTQSEESGNDTLSLVENVIGTIWADEISGDNTDNIIYGNGGDDTLAGLGGNDTYFFTPGWGQVTVIDSSGIDTLDFSALNQDLTFFIGSTLLTVSDGGNLVNNPGVEIEELIAGSGNDLFKFKGSGLWSGSLDGGAGSNSLDLSEYQQGVDIILHGWGSQNAYRGSSSIISGGFDNIAVLIGSPGEDTLTGFNADSIWTLDGDNNTYTVAESGRFINFSQFEKLQGGNLNDIYIIKAGEQAVDIQAGGGHDQLIMEDGSTLAGKFDGQGGYDTLDYSQVKGSVVVQLHEQLGYIDGFNGMISWVYDGFANIQAVLSGSGQDEFYGRDAAAFFHLLDSGCSYQDAASLRIIDFAGFDSLYGGDDIDLFNISGSHRVDLYGQEGNDLFNFMGDGTINGFIDGGQGSDCMNYSGYASARNLDLTGLGSIDGFNGTEASISTGFRNLNHLVGSAYADSLQGLGSDAIWLISGTVNLYETQGTSILFEGIENLIGEEGQDTFRFQDAAVLGGSIDGGSGGGNTLDYTGYTKALQIVLGSAGAQGFSGSEINSIAGTFTGINAIIGSSLSDVMQTLDSDSVFTIYGNNIGSYLSNGYQLEFAGLDKLIAGSGNDTFIFTGTGQVSGYINAGSGVDTMDYSQYHSGVTVSLADGAASNINHGADGMIAGFENLIGSQYDDSLTGDSGSNVITGNRGNDILIGLGGDDTYIFADEWGLDLIIEVNGGGQDTLDFSAVSTDLYFNLGADYRVESNGNILNSSGQLEHLIGGSGNDTFALLGQGVINGSIDGRAGSNILDYSNYDAPVFINLQNSIATGLVSFNNISVFTGSSNSDTIIGADTDTTFRITDTNAGTINDHLSFSGIENLIGGSGNDSFVLVGSGVINGSIDGGAGNNILDYSNYDAPVFINLQNSTATGLGSFNNISVFTGSSNSDTIIGADTDTIFRITDTNAGTINDRLHFNGIENLIGGSGNDSFVWVGNGVLNGSIDGRAGNNILDYSSYDSAVTVDLENMRASGLKSFANILVLKGSNFADTLIGPEAGATFNINGNQTGTLNADFFFSSIENLLGGSHADLFIIQGHSSLNLYGGGGDDTFRLTDGAEFQGILDGEEGNDTLDYQEYTTGVQVNLSSETETYEEQNYEAQSATGINGGAAYGFTGIESVRGSQSDDILFGSSAANIINGDKGDDILIGGEGDDIYLFGDDWGRDTIIEQTGGGHDTISFALATKDLTFTTQITAKRKLAILVSDGVYQLSYETTYLKALQGGWGHDTFNLNGLAPANIYGGFGNDTFNINGTIAANLYGEAGDDSFIQADNSSLSGSIDGGAGLDTLDFSNSSKTRNITVTVATEDGFSGQQNTISQGFVNINWVIGSSAVNDTFTGPNTDSVYTIGDHNTLAAFGYILSFVGYENLLGGNADDTFRFIGNGELKGTLKGGAGSDTLDYSAYNDRVRVDLGSGAATAINSDKNGGISGIENVIGSSLGNTLTGNNSDNILVGGAGDDVIKGAGGNDLLIGGGGNDILDGGTGIDTVDYSRNTTSGIELSLADGKVTSNESGIDTLVSIENVIGTSFDDILIGDSGNNRLEGRGGNDIIKGGAGNDILLGGDGDDIIYGQEGNDLLNGGKGSDKLIGGNGDDIYLFDQEWEEVEIVETADDGVDTLDFSALAGGLCFTLQLEAGSVTSGLSKVSWSGMAPEILIGGSGNDTFALENGASQSITVNGGGGNNTLDYSNYGSAITLNLQQSTATGLEGFTAIQSLVGSALADNLIGFNEDTVFTITGVNAGMVNDSFSFTGIENLTGGKGQDRFSLVGNGSLTGSINGGGGSNTLDYSGYTASAVEISLDSNQATGLGGTFNNIASFIGSSEVDRITGPDTNTLFQVTGADQIIVNGMQFRGFESLTGGSGNDTFKFNNDTGITGITGTIDGGAGRDTIDFSAYISGVTVDLAAGQIMAGGLTGSVINIEDIIGGQGDDQLTGNDEDNIIIGGGGKDVMMGGPGNDQYIFNAGWGIGDEIIDSEGEDTVTFASLTVPLTFIFNDGTWQLSDGANTLEHSGYAIEHIIGGSGDDIFIISGTAIGKLYGGEGNDSFRFVGSGSLEGSIDGGSGVNNIDYRDYHGGKVTVNLAESTSSNLNGSFRNINRFWGSLEVDELIGVDGDNIFNISGTNAGNVNSLYYFDGFENLTGGSGNDTFNMGSNAIIGKVAGGSGQDILNYAGYLRAVNISIKGADASGWAGTESSISGGFSGIDTLQGSSHSDSFTGMNEMATFDLAPDNMIYRVDGFSLNLVSLENLIGGNQADTFNINGTLTLNLSGADGNDTFNFQDQAALNGSLDGGGGNDRIDWSLYQSAQKAVLTGLGSVDGFNGTLGIIRSGFLNINGLAASAAGDTMTGVNNDAVFDLSTGRYSSGNTLDFGGFALLQGGQGNDTFIITEASDYHGKIDGGLGGIDTLDYSGYQAQVSVDLTQGTGTAINGETEKSVSGIEKIIGSLTHDNHLKGDNGNNIFVAGSANNILAGGQGNDTYVFLAGWGATTILENNNEGIDTLDASAIDSKLTFYFENDGHRVVNEDGNTISCDANLENYMGGSNDDTFRFWDEAVVKGTINGGKGHDLLAYIDYQSGRNIVLSGLGSQDGFQGRDASIKGGFDNLDEIQGSLYIDSLKGLNHTARWTLATAKISYTVLGRTLKLAAVENLLGGSGADTFSLTDGAIHKGNLDGGEGIDLLDYSLYTTAVSVNLSNGSSTGITGSISGFENLTGGSGDDHITGDSKDNVIMGGPGNDTLYGQAGHDILIGGTGDDILYGGTGNDIYRFEDNWGSDEIRENEHEGDSTLDFGSVTADLNVILDLTGIYITSGINRLSHLTGDTAAIISGSGQDTFDILADSRGDLYGGAGNDRFVLADGINYSGCLDGQEGSDTVDFSNYSMGRNIVLTDIGAIDGFQGRENSLQAGFNNIDNLVGSMAADTLTGIDSDSIFNLNHGCSYSSLGRVLTFSAFETLAGGRGNDRFEIYGDQTFNLLGGTGNDCFVFADQASLNGTLDGQAGSDSLDFSAYTTPCYFILLATGSSGGFKGSEAVLGQFDSINSIIGSLAVDSITGLDAAAIWQVGSNSSYTSGGSSLAITCIENLLGGAREDKFVLQEGYELEGLIDGRGGDDTLDYSKYAYGSVITVDLNQGLACGIIGGISSIKNVILPQKPVDPPPYSGGGGGGAAKLEGQIIYRNTGGIVESLGVIIEVPVLALPQDAAFSIKEIDATRDYVPEGLAVKLGSKIYEINTSGPNQFGDNNFITIKIPYDPSKIREGEHPVVHYFDEITGQWVEIPSTKEFDANTGQWMAVVKVNHLTKFAVFSTNLDIKLFIGSPLVTVGKQEYLLDAVPYIDAAAWRTMAPVRFISEAMGAQVEWNDAEGKVLIKKEGQEIILTIGSNILYVNGQEVIMDCAPQILSPGRTFVPLRFISENLGARVEYNSDKKEVTIYH